MCACVQVFPSDFFTGITGTLIHESKEGQTEKFWVKWKILERLVVKMHDLGVKENPIIIHAESHFSFCRTTPSSECPWSATMSYQAVAKIMFPIFIFDLIISHQ